MLGGRMDKKLHGSAGEARKSALGRLPGGPRRWVVGGAVVLVAAVAASVWALRPDEVDPRARVYTDATACLLTPADGVNGAAAAPVWAGMQEASLATSGKVQFLEVDGPQTGTQAGTFLATLVNGDCDLVLTVGTAPNAALTASAASYPKTSFVMIGSGKAADNVSVVPAGAPDVVRSEVNARVTAALKDASTNR